LAKNSFFAIIPGDQIIYTNPVDSKQTIYIYQGGFNSSSEHNFLELSVHKVLWHRSTAYWLNLSNGKNHLILNSLESTQPMTASNVCYDVNSSFWSLDKTGKVHLLTLSACQTALGNERAAFGLAGVAIKAGVKSAMATLWKAKRNEDK